MKIFIGHYHLNPGGVTKIIQSQLNGLADKDVELVVICDGQGLENISLPANATILPFKKLGYLPELGTAEELLQEVKAIHAFFVEQVDKTDIIHFHNIGLGKNAAVTYTMYQLASEGYTVVNHAHDFPEDRPVNYKYLKDGMKLLQVDDFKNILYPDFANYHFGVLNGFDKKRLLKAGIPVDRIELWPNPVSIPPESELSKQEAKQKLCNALHLEIHKMVVAYPVRVIRRKNIGEFILLAKVFGDKANFIVTLPPLNPVEIEPYKEWVQFCTVENIPVTFEAGLKAKFEWVMKGADVCFTTSIMEGFGMVFVEPWLWGTPVAGRKIPAVLPDLEAIGLKYPLIYDNVWVKHNGDWVDFPDLEMEEQMQLIRSLELKQIASFIQQNVSISSFFKGDTIQFENNNKQIITDDLSERRYGEKLYSTYKALS